jgi:hypothetical protein
MPDLPLKTVSSLLRTVDIVGGLTPFLSEGTELEGLPWFCWKCRNIALFIIMGRFATLENIGLSTVRGSIDTNSNEGAELELPLLPLGSDFGWFLLEVSHKDPTANSAAIGLVCDH